LIAKQLNQRHAAVISERTTWTRKVSFEQNSRATERLRTMAKSDETIPINQLARQPYRMFIPDTGPAPHQEMIESIGAVDRSVWIVWCARLNLLRSTHGGVTDAFDNLLSARFFTIDQRRRMHVVLKRARRPRTIFLTCFRRSALLEVLRWAVMLGTDSAEEQVDLTLADSMHFVRAAHCANLAAFARITEAQVGPLLDSEPTADKEATYSLPIFAQMSGMDEGMHKDDLVLGRSAILLCEEFFVKNPEWQARFEAIVGMPLDAWLGCVLLAQRLTTGDLAPDPRTHLQQFGIVDIAAATDVPGDTRGLFEAYLAQQTQGVGALRDGLLARLSEKTVSQATPFDTTPLRTRPFIRTRFGTIALCDRVFLEDKLWLGPVFGLLADGISAPLLFGALGVAVERYVIRLIQFAATRRGTARSITVCANPKAGSLEITDVCVRAGPVLVMIECKTAWLPQQAQWEYGDAAFIRAVRERLASYGKSNKGIGQLARSIVGIAEGTVTPDDPALFAGVETVLPVIMVQDTSVATAGLPPFLAQEFASAVRMFSSAAPAETPGSLQIGAIRTALPTMMALSDIELFESMLARVSSIAEFITSYDDPERLIPLHWLVEDAIRLSPQIQFDPASLIAKEGAALRARAMRAIGMQP
jgi:hypothetical protein